MKHFVLSANSSALFVGRGKTNGISYALSAFSNDWLKVFGAPLKNIDTTQQFDIEITNLDNGIDDESFSVELLNENSTLRITGGNELGTIFGIYHVSEHILGIDPYYFWTDFDPEPQKEIILQTYKYISPKPAVRFRGWFINGEDCLTGWHDDEKISQNTWAIIFETMLRSRFNMVIPGTSVSYDRPQIKLASDMGLWITHHHAEPLGAKMFLEVYPNSSPDPAINRDKYEKLYREAIKGYKKNNSKVVFVLGFRGQGDKPFWYDSAAYDTPQKRAAVINEMVKLQKRLISEISGGQYRHFALYVYGESAQLAKAGLLNFSDDMILIWSDNGYGAMRMRRMGKDEPGIDMLSMVDNKHPLHGFYYHINFHDLQASNQLTMLVKPDTIVEQFRKCFKNHVNTYLILNVGNIRPHTFEIEMISKLAFEDFGTKLDSEIISESYQYFCQKHFNKNHEVAVQVYKNYFELPFQFGQYKEDRAGEEIYHYAIRAMIHRMIGNDVIRAEVHKTIGKAWWEYFMYVGDPKMSFVQRLLWYRDKAGSAQPKWDELSSCFEKVKQSLVDPDRQYFQDNIGMQIYFHKYSNAALYHTVIATLAYTEDDTSAENLYQCFLEISKAKWQLDKALNVLNASEHGKWENFYRGDWLTAVRMTIRFVRTFQAIVRIRGESHPYETWYREAIEPSGLMQSIIGGKKIDDDDEYARILLDLTNTRRI
ncbi:MAG: glycosyl hydrolase 115 family protein [Sedimentisphaerales bacterium]